MSDGLKDKALIHLEALQSAGVGWVRKRKPGKVVQAAIDEPGIAMSPHSLFEPSKANPPESAASIAGRQVELLQLADRVKTCVRCAALCSSRTQTVFGVGPVGAEICIVGEAPGADEDRLGEPFVGAAGKLLNNILAACGFERSDVYICNILKCRPPGNRTPLPDESANCREFLDSQIKLVGPKFLCAMGGTAAQNLLQTTKPIGQLRGKFHEYNGTPMMVTYHPAYLLPHRNPGMKKEVWADMKMLLAKMGRPIPPPKSSP